MTLRQRSSRTARPPRRAEGFTLLELLAALSVLAATLAAAVLAAGSPDTKGMTAEGSAFAGQFQQGQVLEQPFNIEPNKCYTVVGIGGPGISELDVQIQYVTPFPTPPVAQDNQTGPNATLGGGGSCWRSQPLTAVPGKVIIRATGGAGIAGAQIFKK